MTPRPIREIPVAPGRISPKLRRNRQPRTAALTDRPLPLAAFAAAALAPVALLALGIALGGAWLWAAFLYMALLTILLDQLIPLATGDSGGQDFPAADLLLVAVGLAALALLPLATWAIAGPARLSPAERILTFLAAGFWLSQVAHPAAHELIHRTTRPLFRLGAAIYAALLFGQHTSSHRLVHHRAVATRDDPNTARDGESFYRFARRAWIGSLREGFRAETALRARAARAQPHPYALYLATSTAALALATLVAGLPGLLVWSGLAVHAQVQILLSDYVQHYGLSRTRRPDGSPEPVGPRHSWNTAHWFSSAMMLNAPRHSDHHVHPQRPFPQLRLAQEAPCLPWPLPVACAIALAPRLWRRAMAPHLARLRETRPRDTAG